MEYQEGLGHRVELVACERLPGGPALQPRQHQSGRTGVVAGRVVGEDLGCGKTERGDDLDGVGLVGGDVGRLAKDLVEDVAAQNHELFAAVRPADRDPVHRRGRSAIHDGHLGDLTTGGCALDQPSQRLVRRPRPHPPASVLARCRGRSTFHRPIVADTGTPWGGAWQTAPIPGTMRRCRCLSRQAYSPCWYRRAGVPPASRMASTN